jgi:hypothetical protein
VADIKEVSAGIEKRDHRQIAPMVVRRLIEVQLGKDAPDVFLDGALGDPQALGDVVIKSVGSSSGPEGS